MKKGNLPLLLALRVHSFDNTSLSFCMIRYNIRLEWKKKGNGEILSLAWCSQTCWINDLMAMKTQLEGTSNNGSTPLFFSFIGKGNIFLRDEHSDCLFILLPRLSPIVCISTTHSGGN